MSCTISRLTMRSICSRSASVTGAKWVKSKRSRSGATSEPAWRTCGPRTSRSAAWTRCVAVWLARIARRRSPSTRARTTRSPVSSVPVSTVTWWTITPPRVRVVSVTAARTVSLSSTPTSPTWPPACA